MTALLPFFELEHEGIAERRQVLLEDVAGLRVEDVAESDEDLVRVLHRTVAELKRMIGRFKIVASSTALVYGSRL